MPDDYSTDAKLLIVFVVHATQKLLDRVKDSLAVPSEPTTTALGNWYATALFWNPQVALFVNEATLLPVFVPLAPGATVIYRFPASLATVLDAHAVTPAFIERELDEMTRYGVTKTANRSIVGIMNEFRFLGTMERQLNGVHDLLALSVRLSETPCGPLYSRHGSPDRELKALVDRQPR